MDGLGTTITLKINKTRKMEIINKITHYKRELGNHSPRPLLGFWRGGFRSGILPYFPPLLIVLVRSSDNVGLRAGVCLSLSPIQIPTPPRQQVFSPLPAVCPHNKK